MVPKYSNVPHLGKNGLILIQLTKLCTLYERYSRTAVELVYQPLMGHEVKMNVPWKNASTSCSHILRIYHYLGLEQTVIYQRRTSSKISLWSHFPRFMFAITKKPRMIRDPSMKPDDQASDMAPWTPSTWAAHMSVRFIDVLTGEVPVER